MSRGGSPLLVVCYDVGSVSPTRMSRIAAEAGARLAFVCPPTAHARQMRPVLECHGAVIDAGAYAGVRALGSAVSALHPAGIVTFSERAIELTAELAAVLGLPYQDVADIPAIRTKAAQRERLRKAGVENVRYARVNRLEHSDAALAHVGLPAIVKPDAGAGSRNTFVVRTAEEYRSGLAAVLSGHRREHELIVEELLVGRAVPSPWGDYVAVDCMSRDGAVEPLFITGRFAPAEPFRERGGYTPPILPAAETERAADLAVRAVRALNIRHGASHTEIKLTEEGPRVIEVNGRVGGWVDDLAVRSGKPSPAAAAIWYALGRTPGSGLGVPPASCSGTVYHYAAIAPKSATRVRALAGLAGLRALPGVHQVAVRARPGQALDWRDGTCANVVIAVTGATGSHEELSALVRRFESFDWAVFDEAGGA